MHLYRKNYTILPLSRKTKAKILQKARPLDRCSLQSPPSKENHRSSPPPLFIPRTSHASGDLRRPLCSLSTLPASHTAKTSEGPSDLFHPVCPTRPQCPLTPLATSRDLSRPLCLLSSLPRRSSRTPSHRHKKYGPCECEGAAVRDGAAQGTPTPPFPCVRRALIRMESSPFIARRGCAEGGGREKAGGG